MLISLAAATPIAASCILLFCGSPLTTKRKLRDYTKLRPPENTVQWDWRASIQAKQPS